jgi:cell cycle checkpoint control protein RAD9A
MYTKALLSVFKSRLYDPLDRDGSIDRCEVSVQDRPDETQCRFVVKMVCDQGVIKTYRLTYEAAEVMHALFDRNVARNRWSMHAGAMKEYIDYFGARTEMLDIFAGDEDGDGRCVFKTYTEKISNGKEILRHPLVTAVAVNTADFEEFNVQPGLHVVISVKDFKAIVLHADTLKTHLKAYYSQPTRPLQFTYGCEGLLCEYTLMTSGDYKAAGAATPASVPQQMSSRTTSHTPSIATERTDNQNFRSAMPPPVEPASWRSARLRNPGSRKGSSPKAAEPDPESLFVRQEEDDARWEPVDYNNEEETLGWDASTDHEASHFPTFRDTGSVNVSRTETENSNEVFAPTQKISQIKGLW